MTPRRSTSSRQHPPWIWIGLALAAPPLALLGGACTESPGVVAPPTDQPECHSDEDCPLARICSLGECVVGCRPGGDRCPEGMGCLGGECVAYSEAGPGDAGTLDCPSDMVQIGDLYCIDRYEASRPDATDVIFGVDESQATSRAGVLPWFPVEKETAELACAMAGKRLCTPGEFEMACRRSSGTVYCYGNDYDPETCNGIDTYCACGTDSLCQGVAVCPYPHCYDEPPQGEVMPIGGCGAAFHVEPTGAFESCLSDYGAVDINGNVWELVDDGTAEGQFRGGAFNCKDSETLHRCDYVGHNINAKGFRCCR